MDSALYQPRSVDYEIVALCKWCGLELGTEFVRDERIDGELVEVERTPMTFRTCPCRET